jgi:cytidylate kinase
VVDGADRAQQGGQAGDHRLVIAIDGPAAAGKSTVANAVASGLGAILFDTGVLYRAVTCRALATGTGLDDEAALARLAAEHHIDIRPASVADGRPYDVLIDDEDVTWAIRDAAVDRSVSAVAAHGAVRSALLPVQRRIASDRGPIVMVGRDIGTTVVPDAGTKIFLNASAAERARRRHQELLDRGVEADLDQLTADLIRRDELDRSREASPLRAAEDAIAIDTDGHSIETVVALVDDVVRRQWEQLGVSLPATRAGR